MDLRLVLTLVDGRIERSRHGKA